MLRIYCRNNGEYREFREGTTIGEMLPAFNFTRPCEILAAKVNNVTKGLTFKVFNNKDIEFMDYRSYGGRNVYCRSLCFLLCKAASDVLPACRIVLRRPLSKGYFCSVDKQDGSPLSEADVAGIRSRMQELVDAALPFYRNEVQTTEAVSLFSSLGQDDKVKLLETCGDLYVSYYTLDGTPEYCCDVLVPDSSYLKVWDLTPYRDGMILRVPDRHNPSGLAPFYEQPKTFNVFSETLRWNRIMGLDTVGDVNRACMNGNAPELIQVAEALQEKKIVLIAEEISRRSRSDNPVRLVLITGPSSSGKSTFCKRLSIQLKACGLRPVFFSTDDYFVNRLDTPKLPDGNYDFDNFETVDHDYLQADVLKLLDGEEVEVPEYNFVSGKREFNGKKLKIGDGTILLIEGIHALNPRLTDQVPESYKFRIFINTVTSISLDDHNCIPTSDNRLLRRIVRDYNIGAYSARQTISNWPNVRRAEVKWIYPYQEDADVLFNSAYLLEFAVLRNHAERILRTVPKNCREYGEAHRLLSFLHYFVPVSDKELPRTSLLRSFIGGSSFE